MRPSMLGVKNHNSPASVKDTDVKTKFTFEEWWAWQGFNDDPNTLSWKHEMENCWHEAQANKQ